MPENGSIGFANAQEIVKIKKLCRIYETILMEKQNLCKRECLVKDHKIAAMIDERDNLMDSVTLLVFWLEKKQSKVKKGTRKIALGMIKMEQNFHKIFEDKTENLDLEKLKYSELLKSYTKKLKDTEVNLEQLKNNDKEQMEIKQIELKNKMLEIKLNAINGENESLKNLIKEFKE